MNDQTTDLAFAPDGRTLAAAGRSGETAVWTVYTSATRTQLSGFESRPGSLAFSDQGVLAGSGSRGELWFWRSGRCPEVGPPSPPPVPSSASRHHHRSRKTAGHTRTSRNSRQAGSIRPRRPASPRRRAHAALPAAALAFDAQGRLVTNDARSLRIWTPGSTSPEAPPSFKHDWPELTRRMSPSAKTADGRTMVFVRPSSLFLWTAESAEKIVPVDSAAGMGAVRSAGPRNQRKPRAGQLGRRCLSPICFATSRSHPAVTASICSTSPSAREIHSTRGPSSDSRDSSAQAHDLNWSVPLADGAVSIALRGDGALLAVGDHTGKVTLVDTVSRAIIAKIPPSSGDSENYRLALAFSPDGQNLAVGSPEGTISLWSLAQPRQPRLALPPAGPSRNNHASWPSIPTAAASPAPVPSPWWRSGTST